MSDELQPAPIVLRAGEAECEIWPHAGGSIGRWTIGNQEMCRRASATAPSERLPLGMATFPLVPYSNRVGFGRFDWNGENYRLAANFPPEAHAIHGTGWTMPWQAEPDGTNAVTLRCAHVPNADWPWPFEAEQRITLSAYTLHIELTARNLSDQPVPLAFGHHPYFDNEGATLSFAAEQVWRTGSDGLPAFAETPQGMFDFTRGDPVQTRILDNGFAGWDGKAHIRWDGRPLTLEIEADVQAAVVYVPEDSNYFCFEPVPHIINALNLPGHMPQMPVVAPGAAYEAQIRFKAEPA